MSEDQKDMNKKGKQAPIIWGCLQSIIKEDKTKLTKDANGCLENEASDNKLMLSDEDALKIGKVFMHMPKDEVEGLLVETISLDTVVPLLGFAQKHNCSVLKRGCLKFIVEDGNWLSLRFCHEYNVLLCNQPSLLDDIKELAQKLGLWSKQSCNTSISTFADSGC